MAHTVSSAVWVGKKEPKQRQKALKSNKSAAKKGDNRILERLAKNAELSFQMEKSRERHLGKAAAGQMELGWTFWMHVAKPIMPSPLRSTKPITHTPYPPYLIQPTQSLWGCQAAAARGFGFWFAVALTCWAGCYDHNGSPLTSSSPSNYLRTNGLWCKSYLNLFRISNLKKLFKECMVSVIRGQFTYYIWLKIRFQINVLNIFFHFLMII